MRKRRKGIVKHWNDAKGFGFIRQDDGEQDVFVHISSLTHLRRRPVVGDIVYYQIYDDHYGKIFAVNIKIKGVGIIKSRRKRSTSTIQRYNLIPMLLFLISGIILYNILNVEALLLEALSERTQTTKKKSQFKCDCRQYCCSKRSKKEAILFKKNCPNATMDDINDGDPRENDSRWWWK